MSVRWMRWTTAAALASVALTACERREAAPTEPAQVSASAGTMAAIPLSWSDKSDAVEATLSLPEAIKKYPALHRTLYDREVALLKTFVADSRSARAEMDAADLPHFASEVKWEVAAETPRLLSLVRSAYEFQGGAHPNTALATLIFDKQTGREVEGEALVAAADLPKLDGMLCDAVKAAKAERGGVELDGETFACPKWADAQLALTGGAGGKSTGVRAMISPYEVGPYAEGSYEVDVPASAFSSALATPYRAEFTG